MTTDSGSSGGGTPDRSSKDKQKSKEQSRNLAAAAKAAGQSLSGNEGGQQAILNAIGASSPAPSLSTPAGGGTPAIIAKPVVPQTPAVVAPPTPVGTDSPRTDSSVVLAGQVNRRPDRSPARSNNFVSLIGSAGGLGRRSGDAKRTLIGGA